MEHKFYWLKVKKDFFKRHDIRIIESLPNGKEISLFYFKLMLESVDHDGELRFSQKVPYSPEMLSTITYTDLEIVREALETLSEYGMIEITPDKTIIIERVKSMIGSASDTDGARRQRRFREKQKTENTSALQNVTASVTKCNDERYKTSRDIEIDIEKEIDIDKKRNIKEKKFSVPTLEEVQSYCQERNNNVDAEHFIDYYSSKGWMVGKSKMKDWRACVRTWERNSFERPVQAIPESIENPFTRLKREEGLI